MGISFLDRIELLAIALAQARPPARRAYASESGQDAKAAYFPG